MNLRPLTGAAAIAANALFCSSAPAADLIAPLDVRVTAEAKPSTVLQGAWNAYPTEDGGVWRGENIKLMEIWQRAASKPVRVRGRVSGGPQRIHYVEVNYHTIRTGEGCSPRFARPTSRDHRWSCTVVRRGLTSPGIRSSARARR